MRNPIITLAFSISLLTCMKYNDEQATRITPFFYLDVFQLPQNYGVDHL